MALSSQTGERVLRSVHDESDNTLKVKITGSTVDVNVNAALDSIAIADEAGNKATTTAIGGSKVGLDVVVQDIAISSDTDSIETRGQAMSMRLDDSTTANVTYVGEAAIGSSESSSVWRIKAIDETSGVVVKWASSGNFSAQWSNRASLTYL